MRNENNTNNGLLILAVVAIVAIVSLTMFFSTSINSQKSNTAGVGTTINTNNQSENNQSENTVGMPIISNRARRPTA